MMWRVREKVPDTFCKSNENLNKLNPRTGGDSGHQRALGLCRGRTGACAPPSQSRRLAQTSLFEVCDAPKGHFEERRSGPASTPHRSLREIADPRNRGLRQPAGMV